MSRPEKRARDAPSGQQTLREMDINWRQPDCENRSTSSLRQSTLHSMRGVVVWRSHQSTEGQHSSLLASIPPTLYLGERDVIELKRSLEEHVDDVQTVLSILRRLSAMPCTRALLESTRIGVAVGRLRNSSDEQIAELAKRLVRVWKSQLAEHRKQKAVRRTSA